ncbi:MAG: SDR family NAD(P)-dependent oxidoreductase [Ignavibacteria bacterium]|jgi:NADP-dependent 3-hydroxy acid dehydrogenase YdfG
MNSLKNKIVFITGATDGIGKSCTYAFAKEGADLIITARRINVLNEMAENISNEFGVKVHAAKMDVRDFDEVNRIINSLPDEWKNIDILLNNAGLARGFSKIHEGKKENWEEMIDTNVKGLLYVTKEIVKGMNERNSGHVINMGSVAGHMSYSGGGVYCATKFAVRAITDALRLDLLNKNIRVSSVDPGAVETNFSNVRFDGDEEKAKNVYRGMTPLTGDDVAETVIFCATRPPHANINEIVISSSAQANSFFIHREE